MANLVRDCQGLLASYLELMKSCSKGVAADETPGR